jgi:hypothetical protein
MILTGMPYDAVEVCHDSPGKNIPGRKDFGIVREMAFSESEETLLGILDDLEFPSAGSYALNDITRTHYDYPDVRLGGLLRQKHLRWIFSEDL